jgi:hypothetical protein
VICEQSRDRLAQALRRYVAGRISNDDLDSVEIDWRDRGAAEVKRQAWFLYDDTRHHYAKGRYAINSDTKRIIARWIVFLHCDKEYLWPDYSSVPIINWVLSFFTFGWWGRRESIRRKEFEEAGDFSAWPFISTTELDDAAKRPRYLAGHRRH